jgi:hypothetical protein
MYFFTPQPVSLLTKRHVLHLSQLYKPSNPVTSGSINLSMRSGSKPKAEKAKEPKESPIRMLTKRLQWPITFLIVHIEAQSVEPVTD